MKVVSFSAALVLLAFTACSKHSEQPSSNATPQSLPKLPAVEAASPADASPAPPAPQEPAKLSETEPLGGKGRPLTDQEINLMNYGISMFKQEKGRYPATLEEAVKSGQVAAIPELPANQKLDYDPKSGVVKVITK